MCELYEDIFNFLKNVVVHIAFDHNANIRFKNLDTKYIIIGNLLYQRSFDVIFLDV